MLMRCRVMGAQLARALNRQRRLSWLPALLLIPALLPAQAQQGQDPTTEAVAPGDPPGRAGRISVLTGPASFQSAGSTDWTGATVNYTVTTGDRLYTDQQSRAEIEIGTSAVRLSGTTDVTLTNLTDHLIQLGIASGTMHLSVYRMDPGDSVEIDTPNGAFTAAGPGDYRVEIPQDNASTIVSVERGSLEATGPGLATSLRAGQTIEFAGVSAITTLSLAHPAPTAFDQWSADRDHRLAASGCTRYVSGDIPGCADLDQNGRWAVDATNGPVWYPTSVAADWVPYRFGHWVWIEPWGWTWVDDAPWGFAPFHYGRWESVGARWGWIPGPIVRRPYYAPALVAFVGGSNFSIGFNIGVQAWFPLGPREPYFPWYHYGDRYLRTVNYTNIRNVADINTLVRVRNVEDIHYVNRGAAITAVPTATFSSGRPVNRDVVRVTPAQVARAEVLPHPSVAPQSSAAIGVRGSSHPPVVSARPAMITAVAPRGGGRPTMPAPAVVAASRAGSPALITRAPPPGRAAGAPPTGRSGAPAAAPQAAPANVQAGNRNNGPRALITRAPPPPATPPFAAREPALQQHAGRPLEPQQMQNLRGGQPAGPQRDPEFPPHAGAQPPRSGPAPSRGAAPAPASRGAPPASAGRGGAPPAKRGGGGRR